MSARICVECENPQEYGATLLHVCHCDESAGDLRVLIHLRDTEVTRLRAALAEIAALQTEEPVPPAGSDDDYKHGYQDGRYEASSLARRALDGGA